MQRRFLIAIGLVIGFTAFASAQLTHTTTIVSQSHCGTSVGVSMYTNWMFTDSSGAHAFSVTTEFIPPVRINVSGKIETCPGTGISTTRDANSSDNEGYHLHAVGQAGSITEFGSIAPKYVVVAVAYAPPGSKSTVDYGTSTLLGSGTSLMNSFTSSTSLSVSVGASGSIPGILSGGATTTTTTAFTQEGDSTTTVSLNKSSSFDIIVPGPSSSAVGVDHAFDVVFIWLNPVVTFTVVPSTGTVQWTGYGFDERDPALGMDIVAIELGQLQNPALITNPNTLQSLARTWAGTGEGLANADLLTIAGRDPFSNPGYTVTIPSGSTCTADLRFCSTTNQDISYQPPAPGGQPITEKFNTNYQMTASQGQSATDTYQVGYSTDLSAKGGFIIQFSLDIKSTDTFTWSNKWSTTRTTTTGQTASFSVTGPATTDNYTGPTAFNVFQDNVYGTFMFAPAN